MGGTITVNSVTGQLLATPEALGLYAVGVCAKEYRAGVLLSITRRDFLFRVMNCEITMEAIITPQVDMSTFVSFCQGLTIDFENESYGGTNYAWDFGVPGITTDVSTAFEPSYTFPSAGTYDVMLVVNPGWPCTDTSIETFIINEAISAEFTPPAAQCIVNNDFDFFGNGEYPPVADGTTFLWDFGASTDPATAATEDVTDVTFDAPGYHEVIYTVYYDICEVSYTDSVFVYAEPTIDFTIADELRCAPYTAHFIDLSTADTEIFYEWSFGDGTELSPEENPTHVYENPGLYDVQLTIWTTSGCIDTLTLMKEDLIEVFPSPVSAFTVSPNEADVFHPHFHFSDQSIDSDQHFYYFTDGTSTVERNVWHSYVESGYHYPYQVVINQYGCPDTSWQQIYVIPHTTIYIPNAFTPDGNNFNNIWLPVVHDTEDYRLLVYNRWGELLKNTDNEKEGWDGTTPTGDLAPQGVYTYKIWWVDADTHLAEEKIGHFTLLR
jgi:gliding motility-associated-like protein